MNEAYAEWLVKRKTPATAYILRAIMAVLCVISVIMALISVLGVILMTIIGIATYFVFRNSNVEYEYVYVTNQLTIDKIMGKAARKKAWEGTMDHVQIVADEDSYLVKDFVTQNTKNLDFSSGMPGVKKYALVYSGDGGRSEKVIFEPNDKLLNCMKMTAPRKVVL